MFSSQQKQELLALARASIQAQFVQHKVSLPTDEDFNHKRGVFVSLHLLDELRGCIGYIRGYKSIAASIMEMAVAAAFRDPRFAPLSYPELDKLKIEISVLGELVPLSKEEEPVIGRDGLYIEHPYGSGLLLPQVALEWKWNAATFLKEVCRKAGLAGNAYLEPQAALYRFSAEVFSESDTF